ncbi:MAG: efflux RND transporter permease subunit [bacterium]
MSLINSSIRFPVTVIVGVLIAIMGGFVALTNVPIQLTPEVKRPVIQIITNWFGASPEEIEKEIVDKQEEFLKSVEGVHKMNSSCQTGQGVITLEFLSGTDITGALVKVTNKLNEVPAYPDDADRPIVRSSNQFEGAIAWFAVRGDSGVYVPHMQRVFEDLVQPRLERVQGVASVNSFGGLDDELHVIFDPELLASAGITIPALTQALRSENRDISAGDFGEGKRRYVVRTMSRFETIEDVKQTVITVRSGVPIRVGDVAEVTMEHRKPFALVRHNGYPSIAFNAQRQVGANVLDVIDGLLAEVEVVNREILAPRGMEIRNVYTETEYIHSAVDLVFSNIYLGGFLAIATLFIFLRSVSTIVVIGMSIPISIITTFLTMFLFGRSINVISLAGMAFAVGMVVDSAIVVLENIYRHMQMGKSRWKAASEGAQEVWGALLASTVTTVAVFLPIIFIEQRAGQLFKDIAIAISSAIVISLIVAITVIPSLSSRILSISTRLHGKEGSASWLVRLADRISAFVDYVNAKGFRRLATILGILLVSAGFSWLLLPDTEYLPNGNQNFIFGILLPPPGYNLDEMIQVGQNIEQDLRHLWETPVEEAGDLPGGGVDNFFYVALTSQAFMGMTAREESRVRELEAVTNGALSSVPGAFGFARQASLFTSGFSGTRSVNIDVVGADLTRVIEIASHVFAQIPEVLPGAAARPIPSLDLGSPEVHVFPDRVRAADVGFSATDIGLTVNSLVDGAIVSEYRLEGREIDLILKGRDQWTRHTQDIAQLPLATPSGRIITLGDIADVRLRQGPVSINRVERQRAITLDTALPNDIALEDAMTRIYQQIIKPLRESGEIGGVYDIRLAGTADDLSRLQSELLINFNLAVILTYLLLAALFQSFTYPLVILMTVPLATFGGVFGLRIVQLFDSTQQLDILTMLGFFILVGTVINNSILIVYHALQLIKKGQGPREAVKESVRVRVRPIFMSTATSVLAMMPLVVMPGAGSELYRGLGSVVIGGLAFSSVITLILTPLVFSYMIELVLKLRRMFGMAEIAASRAPEIEGGGV